MKNIQISPSLICMDLCNLAEEIRTLEALNCKMLHVDVIDGRFSPDMPLGIDMIRQLRKRTDLIFDTHLMAADNTPYIDLLLESGIDRLCFHMDYEPRPAIQLRKIRNAGCKAGIALSPETPLSLLEPLLCLCDFVLIMRIDPGYAHLKGTQIYPHVNEKLRRLSEYITGHGLDIEIEVDGRVGFDDIPALYQLGVSTFVSGTKSFFYPTNSRKENWEIIQNKIKEAVKCTGHL